MQQYVVSTSGTNDFSGGNFSASGFGTIGGAANMSPLALILTTLLLIWALTWKGLALWKASKKDSRVWFVILLVVNTMGILEIIYFYFIDNTKKEALECKEKDCICMSEVKEKIDEEVNRIEKNTEKWWNKAIKKLKK